MARERQRVVDAVLAHVHEGGSVMSHKRTAWVVFSVTLVIPVALVLSACGQAEPPEATARSSEASTPSLTPTPSAGLSIEPTMVSPVDGMVQVHVPAGVFLMGSAELDADAWGHESPQHEVYLDAFWIDRTEVTNGMYARCVDAGACQPPIVISGLGSWTRSSYYGNASYTDYPVIYVDWHQAEAYRAWTGRRLPTEAEWEKATRGVDGRSYPWGEGIDCARANFTGCEATQRGQAAILPGRVPTERWTWRETCGSGWRTGTAVTITHNRPGKPSRPILRGNRCRGAVRGTTFLSSCRARPPRIRSHVLSLRPGISVRPLHLPMRGLAAVPGFWLPGAVAV